MRQNEDDQRLGPPRGGGEVKISVCSSDYYICILAQDQARLPQAAQAQPRPA